MLTNKVAFYCLIGAWIAGGTAYATRKVNEHPFSLTEARVYVEREKATAAIEVFAEDLFLFHNLQANRDNILEPDTIRDGVELHKEFLLDRFSVIDLDGNKLPGVVVNVEMDEMKPEGIHIGDLMEFSIRYKLEYELAEPPSFLSFSQQMIDEALGIPAEMTLRVLQAGSGSEYPAMLLPGSSETVAFDWNAPAPSPEASQKEWDEYFAKRRDETLGITSYSSVYSFIYLEDHEVRHEILVPLLSLDNSVIIPRDEDMILDLEEQELAREQIAAYFTSGNPVIIDGKRVENPRVARLDFYGPRLKDFAMQAEAKDVSLANARVGVILSYPSAEPPENVEIQWDRFNDFIFAVQSLVYTDDSVQKFTFNDTDEFRQFRWKRETPAADTTVTPVRFQLESDLSTGGVPVLTLMCVVGVIAALIATFFRKLPTALGVIATVMLAMIAVAGWNIRLGGQTRQLAPKEANTIFTELHTNLYRSFSKHEETAVYDAMANTVDGPMLRDLYLQVRKSLAMEEQGGAVSRIRDVKIEQGGFDAVEDLTAPGFAYHCIWTVDGSVEHWGHIHSRTNRYEAQFAVEPRGESWKITQVKLINEKRLPLETKLRGLQ